MLFLIFFILFKTKTKLNRAIYISGTNFRLSLGHVKNQFTLTQNGAANTIPAKVVTLDNKIGSKL